MQRGPVEISRHSPPATSKTVDLNGVLNIIANNDTYAETSPPE